MVLLRIPPPLAQNICCSVIQLCPTLCDPMDCGMPGLSVHHPVLELTHTHVHWVGDAIQPSHPLSFPSPPAFNLSSIRVFSNESVLRIRWPKYWSFSFSSSPSNDYSRLISFMIDWFNLLLKIPGMWIPGIHQKHLLITQRLVCQTHCSKREHLQIKWS